MKRYAFGLLALILSSNISFAGVKEFIEEDIGSTKKQSDLYREYKQKAQDAIKVEGGLGTHFKAISARLSVPGLASATPLPRIAKIVGPSNEQFFIGSTVYLSWIGAPGPKENAVYSVFTPSVLLQNSNDPSDFIARPPKAENQAWPKGFHPAGYLYDTNAEIKITKISRGIVEAKVLNMRGGIFIHDELMVPMPRYESISPIAGGIQTSAVVVSGSPYERLIPLPDTFIYINRGAKDGMKVGRVFSALESVGLSGISSAKPMKSLGEAMVVFVSDAFSTAMITKQFDTIRIGSLLQSKQGLDQPENYTLSTVSHLPLTKQDIRPERDLIQTKPKALTPKQPVKALSELDALEQRERAIGLSPEEKERLDRLNQQESIQETTPGSEEEGLEAPSQDNFDSEGGAAVKNEAPSLPPPPSAFVQQKEVAKRDSKKKAPKKPPRGRDEEELNQLMMQD